MYLDQIKLNIDKLKGNKKVTVKDFSFGPGVSKDVLSDIEKDILIKLPDDIELLFSSFNGLQVEWTYDDLESCSGYLNIPTLFDSLGLRSENNKLFFDETCFEGLLWTQYLEEDEIAERKKFKLIESLNGADGDFCYTLSDKQATEIYFLDKSEIVNTGGTLKEYMDFVIKTVGMQNQRYCFIEKNKLDDCLKLQSESKILSELLGS